MGRKMGIPALERSIFLDDRREAPYIEAQVRRLLSMARTEGIVVAIGHPDRVTVEVLKRSAALLRDSGVRLMLASEIALAAGGVE